MLLTLCSDGGRIAQCLEARNPKATQQPRLANLHT
jgi:hypothetical protein